MRVVRLVAIGVARQPRTFVLRARADDGGLYHDAGVTLNVAPAR